MSTIRFGIIGYGNMGRHHAAYLNKGEVKNATVTAICDEKTGKTVSVVLGQPVLGPDIRDIHELASARC